jgi:hypothetical protein
MQESDQLLPENSRTGDERSPTCGQGEDPTLEFKPIEIRGEPLSATVLRERR